MNDISRKRFDALAAYARHPLASIVATELRWLEFAGERVLAALLQDADADFSAVILARDLNERYRWVDMTGYFASPARRAPIGARLPRRRGLCVVTHLDRFPASERRPARGRDDPRRALIGDRLLAADREYRRSGHRNHPGREQTDESTRTRCAGHRIEGRHRHRTRRRWFDRVGSAWRGPTSSSADDGNASTRLGLLPRRAAPRPHASRLRPGRPDWCVLGQHQASAWSEARPSA